MHSGDILHETIEQTASSTPDVNWRPQGISHFESLWSILHKFAYLNRASTSDIRRTFCIFDSAPISLQRFARRLRQTPIMARLRLDTDTLHYAVTEPYELFHHRGGREIASFLRYCPTCIDRGFHSPLYQFFWMSRCPLHGDVLMDVCPACGSRLPYELQSKAFLNPFGCRCGKVLWSGRDARQWAAPLDHHQERLLKRYLDWKLHISSSREFAYRYDGASVMAAWTFGISVSPCKWPAYLSDICPVPDWPKQTFFRAKREVMASVSNGAFRLTARDGDRAFPKGSDSNDLREVFVRDGVAVVPRFGLIYGSVRRKIGRLLRRYHGPCLAQGFNKHNSHSGSQKPIFEVPRDMACPWHTIFREWQGHWDHVLHSRGRANWLQSETDPSFSTDYLFRSLGAAYLKNDEESQEQRRLRIEWIAARIIGVGLLTSFYHTARELMGNTEDDHFVRQGPYFLYSVDLAQCRDRVTWWTPPVWEWLRSAMAAPKEHRAKALKLRSVLVSAERRYLSEITRRSASNAHETVPFLNFVTKEMERCAKGE